MLAYFTSTKEEDMLSSTTTILKETKEALPEAKKELAEANDVFISVLKHENSQNVTFRDLKIESPEYLDYKHPSDFCATVQDKDKKVEVGVAEVKWNRHTQEDAVAIAINEAAQAISRLPSELRKIAHELTFEELNQSMGEPGSTGVVATCWKEGKEAHVNVANAGDSGAYLVVVRNGKVIKSELLNTLHRPDVPEEKARIEAHGATVWKNRVNASLAVSRAFGDKSYQSSGVIVNPEVKDIPPEMLEPGDKAYVIVACDGLEALSIEEIGRIVAANSDKSPAEIANILVSNNVGTRRCSDNTSVVCIPVSDIPISAGVFDGHGGDETSRQVALNFYKVLLKHALALAEPKKYEELLAARKPKKAQEEKVQCARDMLKKSIYQLQELKKEKNLFDINVFETSNHEGIKIRFGNKEWIGGPQVQKVRMEICQLAATLLNATSDFNYYGCDVVLKDQDKLNEKNIGEFITGVSEILTQYATNKQTKALQKALLEKELEIKEAKEKPVVKTEIKAEVKSAETNTLKPEISLTFSRSPNPNAKDYLIVSPKIILEEEEKKGVIKKPANIIFLVDRSESMQGDRLNQVKESLKLIIRDKLSDQDTIQIVTFNDGAELLFSGKKSELENIDQSIDGIKETGGTNFSKPFDLLNPEMFGKDKVPFICFLTDGDDVDGNETPEVILQHLKEKLGFLPPIVALGISKGCKIEVTKKFDTPQERGLYAESAMDIVRQFGEVTELIGKKYYPVNFKFSTAYETRGGEIGQVRSDGLPLQSGLWRIPMSELSSSSEIRGEMTVGSEKFQFTQALPQLENVRFDPLLVKLYFLEKLKGLNTTDKGKNNILIRMVKNELLKFKTNDKEFNKNYSDLVSYIVNLELKYCKGTEIDNTKSASQSAFVYSLASAQSSSFSLEAKSIDLQQGINEILKDHKSLPFPIFQENMVDVLKKKATIHVKLDFKNTGFVYFNPQDAAYSKYAEYKFQNLLDVVQEVRKTFYKADTTSADFLMLTCVVSGSGNPLMKALFSSYLVALGERRKIFAQGSVKVFHGLTDQMDQIHFWTIYQTGQHIYLIDPTNDDPHCVVDLTDQASRDNLIDYYKTRNLSGILRDTFAMFNFDYHDQELVNLHPESITSLDQTFIPENLICPNTNKIMNMPVSSEQSNFNFVFDGESVKKDQQTKLVPASNEIQQIKHLVAQHMRVSRLKMNLSTVDSEKPEMPTTPSQSQSAQSTTAYSSVLFPPVKERKSDPIIYLSVDNIILNQLKVMFPDQEARDEFLRKTDLEGNPNILRRIGFENCFYLLTEPYRRGYRINFGDPAAVERFTGGLKVNRKNDNGKYSYEDILCHSYDGRYEGDHYNPNYLCLNPSNKLSPSHLDMIEARGPNARPPEVYFQFANGVTKLLTKEEYLAEQSKSGLQKPGLTM